MPDDWTYTPSCPCDRCEAERKAKGMTMMYGLGPRPDAESRPHHNFGERRA
jgi:hypothetical protein